MRGYLPVAHSRSSTNTRTPYPAFERADTQLMNAVQMQPISVSGAAEPWQSYESGVVRLRRVVEVEALTHTPRQF